MPSSSLRHWTLGVGYWIFALFSSSASATQTAFWRPYEPDESIYLLMHFDEPDFAKTLGEPSQAELLGDAAKGPGFAVPPSMASSIPSIPSIPSASLRLSGSGAVRITHKGIFRGGSVAIEAWLKLDRYPEKEGFVVCRPAVVDSNPQYDPQRDRTKGFSLSVDSKGALHLETVNVFYGNRVRTSSPPGVVPLGRWVHVAGISAGYRRLYVNGHEVASAAITWGQGLAVHGDEEIEPGPLYIGNDASGKAGLVGLIDEVRIHRNVYRLWEREDMAWARKNDGRPIPTSAPFFVPGHEPALYLPLDGDTTPARNTIEGLRIETPHVGRLSEAATSPRSGENQSAAERRATAAIRPGGAGYVEGVCKQALCGALTLSAPRLLDLSQGSLEFWFQPYGVNNWSDRNVGFVSAGGAFTLYIFNGGGPGRPLSLYYANRRGELTFLSDEGDYYEGRWRHAAITWRDRTVSLYIDGKLRASDSSCGLVLPQNKGVSTSISFGPNSFIDEVYVYRKALLPEEVANAFLRYREPEKMRQDIRLDPIEIEGLYIPELAQIRYRLISNIEEDRIRDVTITLAPMGGRELFRKARPFSCDEAGIAVFWDLQDGPYRVAASVGEKSGKTEAGGSFIFEHRRFAWLAHHLGLPGKVVPPFTPRQINGREVSVVLRKYKVNNLALFDSINAAGRELLAAPMSLRYWANGAEGKWDTWFIPPQDIERRVLGDSPFSSVADAGNLRLSVRSYVHFDGFVLVRMDFEPRQAPAKVDKCWLDIPLRADQAKLLHETTDTLRQNFAGALPAGEGVVWDSRKGHRSRSWLNAFTAYIWLGNPNRGLAWYAENDAGWGTRKDMTLPIQEIIREGDRVILRIHLFNQPTVITERQGLEFGLQASPTKPMPAGWRAKLPNLPTGLAVVPWGGLNCSYQGPYHDDWRIVDKILEARGGGKVDTAWFQQYAKEHNPPPAHGMWPWLDSVLHFAGRAKDVGPNKPLTVYHEEMAACTVRDEWKIFADEWTTAPESFHRGPRTEPDESVFRSGKDTNPSAGVNFCRSYQDFGCWFANEWLKRGVSLYWDNTYPRSSLNFRTSAAYVTETGDIQPAVLLWSQREYQMRVWNLLQEWRAKRPEPLEWVNHMTNTLVLPIHTWATANLDHELGSDKPFSPEWLQAETIGRQVGNYPLTLYPITGTTNKEFEKARPKPPKGGTPNEEPPKGGTPNAEALRYRAEWGMRMVHEIQTNGGKLYELVKSFGYESAVDAVDPASLPKAIHNNLREGIPLTPPTVVHNYWADEPTLAVEPPQVKWLVIAKPQAKEMLIVLASWATEDAKARVVLDPKRLGMPEGAPALTDAEDGSAADPAAVVLPGPYGVRVLKARF